MSILRGAAWMVTFKFIDRGLGMVSTIILARLLLPADFGLVAMAMSVIALLELLGAFGFEVALIQNQNTERYHYDTVWTFNLLFGCCYAVLLLSFSAPAAGFYDEPRLEGILQLLALASLARGFENVGVIDFRKHMLFRQDFAFMLSKRMVAFVVTVVLAFTFGNYWALIVGMVTGRVAGTALSFLMHPFRPRLSFKAGRSLFNFSKWILLNNLVGFFQSRSVDFVLGKYGGAHSLGVYSIGAEIGRLPTTEVVAPINRAAFPGYSKVAHDRTALTAEFQKIIGFIMFLAIPAGVGLATVAELAVRVLLGEKWMEAVPIIQVVSLSGVVNVMKSNMGTVFYAIGAPRLITIIEAVVTVLYLPMMVWGVLQYGAMGAAWAGLAVSLLTWPINLFVFFRATGVGPRPVLAILWRPVAAVLVMTAALLGIGAVVSLPEDFAGSLVELLLLVLVGAIVYGAAVFLLWMLSGGPDTAERIIVENIIELRNRLGLWKRSILGGN